MRAQCCLGVGRCCDNARRTGWRLRPSKVVGAIAQVRGHLERNGERVAGPALFGRWDEAMYAELPGGQPRLLWQKNPPPAEPTRCAQLFYMSPRRPCSVCESVRVKPGHASFARAHGTVVTLESGYLASGSLCKRDPMGWKGSAEEVHLPELAKPGAC